MVNVRLALDYRSICFALPFRMNAVVGNTKPADGCDMGCFPGLRNTLDQANDLNAREVGI